MKSVCSCSNYRENKAKIRLMMINCLKAPERYGKYLQVSSSVKGKSLTTLPSGKEWAT